MTSYTEQNVAAASEFPSQGFLRLLADSGRVHADAIAFSEQAKDLGVAAIWVLTAFGTGRLKFGVTEGRYRCHDDLLVIVSCRFESGGEFWN
jgi:hypothetical protein